MATHTNSILGDLLTDATALTMIAAILSEEEWDSDTTSRIHEIVLATGRHIENDED